MHASVTTRLFAMALASLSLSLAACSSSGGGDGDAAPPTLSGLPTTPVLPTNSGFPASLFPVQVAGSGAPANATFNESGDLLLVAGGDRIHRFSKTTGVLDAIVVTGTTNAIISVACLNDVIYAGTSDGIVYEIETTPVQSITPITDVNPNAITALAIAPPGFAAPHAGRLVASITEDENGPGGVLSIDLANPATPDPIISNAGNFAPVDFAFSEDETLLYVIDAVGRRIWSHPGQGGQSNLASVTGPNTFFTPVGLAVDPVNDQLLVADAGDPSTPGSEKLYGVDLIGGAPTIAELGGFDFAEHPLATLVANGVLHDGVRAVLLVANGSSVARGAVVPSFATDAFPVSVPGAGVGYGGMTLDVEGNVIGTVNAPNAGDPADQNAVFRVDRGDASVSRIVSGAGNPGEELQGIAYEPVGEQIFVGTSTGRILRIDKNGVATPFSDLGVGAGAVNGLAIAPPSVPAYAGQIYAATSGGRMWRVNQTGFPTGLADNGQGDVLHAPVFAPHGTLYVANFSKGSIDTVDTDSGLLTTILSLPGQPDGMTINGRGDTLYVADSQLGRVHLVSIGATGTDVTLVDTRAFDMGPEPSGIVFDGLDKILMGTGEDSLQIEAHVIPSIP